MSGPPIRLSAQALASRTSGSSSRRPCSSAVVASPARWLPSTVAAFRKRPRRLARHSGVCRNRVRKSASLRKKSSARRHRVLRRLRHKCGFVGCRDASIPGTHLLADIAAENPISDTRSQFRRDRTTLFDGQIADAARRVQNIGFDERGGRTGIQARSTRAAVISLLGGVVVEFLVSEQSGQEEPASQLPVEQQGVLADPAQPGQLCELPFQQRRGIDHAAHTSIRPHLGQAVGRAVSDASG